MISNKCDKSKNKAWCWSCDMCLSRPILCFLYNETITYRERQDHMHVRYNDPNQCLVCRKCKVNKHISHYRFKHYTCKVCLHLKRYRVGHTKETFLEHVEKFNIEISS